MRRPARFASALAVAALALAASGCGGDDEPAAGTTEPTAWAAAFCTSVTAWTDEVQRIRDDVDDPSALSVDRIEQAADDLSAATDDFVDEVRTLGRPDTESGQEVEDSLDALADTLDAERTEIRQALDDVSGITDIPDAISTIGTSLSAMSDAFGDALQAVQEADVDGELERALEDAEECDEIGG